MSKLERTSQGTEDLLKGLAVAIGAQMQQAIGRLGTEIKDAVSNATAEGQGPLMQQSAELLSTALTAELVRLKEQIGSMSDQFSERFNGASEGLVQSVQGFQPTVEALSGVEGDAQRAVVDAVGKLNAHEAVMGAMAEAAVNINQAATAFGAMNDSLFLATQQNNQAAQAQLSAAAANERVAGQFNAIAEGLPGVIDSLREAAEITGPINASITDLRTVLTDFQAAAGANVEMVNQNAAQRDEVMVNQNAALAAQVAAAAAQFANIGGLANNLNEATGNLARAANWLGQFGIQVEVASTNQLAASTSLNQATTALNTAAAASGRTAEAFGQLPAQVTALTNGLNAAGTSVREGANAASESYARLIALQNQWFAGATIGLNAVRDQLQTIITAYGNGITAQTTGLMNNWTIAVTECLNTYAAQVEELQGGIEELQQAIGNLKR